VRRQPETALPFVVAQVVPDADGDLGGPPVDQDAVDLGVLAFGDDTPEGVDEGRVAGRVVGVVGPGGVGQQGEAVLAGALAAGRVFGLPLQDVVGGDPADRLARVSGAGGG
jgi:hypothetical protein